MSDQLSVVVADDHATWRASVRVALEGSEFAVVAEASDAPAAVEAVVAHRPDVALLDINMPGGGVRAAGAIHARVPDTAIVMLTVSRADDDLFSALEAGARGYLMKDIDPARLPLALKGVLEGEAALPRTLVTRLIAEFRAREAGRRLTLPDGSSVRLSAREWEVLDLLAEGLSTAEIAARKYVAPVTVRSHVAAILKKLQVASRREAVDLINRQPG